MKRFLAGFMAMAAVGLVCGCSTTAMKGTPFYTGEGAKASGMDSNRVNLWPLVYRSGPSLSVAWPIFESTDDHLAVRPFFSVYGRDQEPGAGRSLNAKSPCMGILFHATFSGNTMNLDLVYVTDNEGNLMPVKAPWNDTQFALPKCAARLGAAAGKTPHVFTGMAGGYAFRPVKEDWLTIESPRGPQGWAGIAVAWENHCYGVVKLARDSSLAFMHMEQNDNAIQSRLVPVADGKGTMNGIPSGLRVDRHEIKR